MKEKILTTTFTIIINTLINEEDNLNKIKELQREVIEDIVKNKKHYKKYIKTKICKN